METLEQWQINHWKETEEGRVFLQYIRATGDTEPIGLQVPTGYPSGIKDSQDIIKVYQKCIEKCVTWKKLLRIPKDDPDIII